MFVQWQLFPSATQPVQQKHYNNIRFSKKERNQRKTKGRKKGSANGRQKEEKVRTQSRTNVRANEGREELTGETKERKE